jgi:5-oxopent-3-ene-1,2,5-tricarboxylate decarboxylase/2-hydroxyhepta-2,4-diene-1,7-dioate isomerase
MNDPRALLALGDRVQQAPYKAAPRTPVLFMKPRNTHAQSGSRLLCPADSEALKIGASLGIVIKKTACRVTRQNAFDYIAGFTIVNDVSLPMDSYYRPSLRLLARDGFCPVGPRVVPRASVADPDALAVRVFVDGVLKQESSTAGRLRPVAQLLSEVTQFMTLQAGDILMLGEAAAAPTARPAQQVAIEIEGLGRLENTVVSEGASV